MSRSMLVLGVLGLGLPVAAQLPVLAPTSSITIDVNPTFGVLSYASIAIPANVVVTFSGDYPVRITVAGDVRIDGTMDVGARVISQPFGSLGSGPGSVMTGFGRPGYYWWSPGYWEWNFPNQTWVPGRYVGTSATNGRHATLYGTAMPFDLAGGSPGGPTTYESYWGTWEQRPGSYLEGGGGGGTLVIEAVGRIHVSGVVTADGMTGPSSAGSGGSILLRGLRGCVVASGARVTAVPEGIVRLDAYDLLPQIAGIVRPPPTVVRYPHLAEVLPPTIGATWQLRVAAPRGDVVFLAASFLPGSGTTAYGTYGIDLGTAITFGVVTVPGNGHDPLGTFDLPIPNVPQLAGLALWVQGLDWFTSQQPRYTQTIATMVR